MSLHGIVPETCYAHTCDRRGQALVERYDIAPGDPGTFEPSGDWIWLCEKHVLEEFA